MRTREHEAQHERRACLDMRKILSERTSHLHPCSLSWPGTPFWIATLVRWMKLLVMSPRSMVKRWLENLAKPRRWSKIRSRIVSISQPPPRQGDKRMQGRHTSSSVENLAKPER